MARYFKFWVISCWMLAAVSLASCQEGGEAGDLWSQWRMVDSDTKFIGFSGRVSVFRIIQNGVFHEVYANFQHVNDSLFIQCVSIKGEPADTAIIEHDFGFRPFTDIRVKIERLDNDNLVLSKDNRRWSLNKY